ncbi:unnamed protein product [Echinostoma caproni]|uniref:SUN domain-containing protein n=1 Tax=Echinostoma caproni TaxID=27848 RepID=A0A183ADB2_9TREM|nr:unnamed protein product [Echinostoma caproni]
MVHNSPVTTAHNPMCGQQRGWFHEEEPMSVTVRSGADNAHVVSRRITLHRIAQIDIVEEFRLVELKLFVCESIAL